MARKQHTEDFSKFRYAEMGGLDELHEQVMNMGFQVHPCETYIRIYIRGKYVATGKIVEVDGSFTFQSRQQCREHGQDYEQFHAAV